MKPRVLLDGDGVVVDFLGPALAVMNSVLGTNAKLSDMKTWYLFDAFDFEVSPEQRKQCYDIWKMRGWCKSLPVLPGAREGVLELMEIADVFFCTSPMDGDTWVSERAHWLKKHFKVGRDRIAHTDGKFICSGDFFVDDKTEHCVTWGRCYPDGLAVRWRQYTNLTTPYSGITTDDWKTLHDLVRAWKPRSHRSWTHPTT